MADDTLKYTPGSMRVAKEILTNIKGVEASVLDAAAVSWAELISRETNDLAMSQALEKCRKALREAWEFINRNFSCDGTTCVECRVDVIPMRKRAEAALARVKELTHGE